LTFSRIFQKNNAFHGRRHLDFSANFSPGGGKKNDFFLLKMNNLAFLIAIIDYHLLRKSSPHIF
jgi:hypothetical protein